MIPKGFVFVGEGVDMSQLDIVKRSSLHSIHLELNASMIEESRWERPNWYIDPDAEMAQITETVGICDISPVSKLLIEGQKLNGFCNKIGYKTSVKRGNVVPHSLSEGKMVLCRLSENQLLVVTSPENIDPMTNALTPELTGCLHLTDLTSLYTGILVCGPQSRALLETLTNIDLREPIFPNMRCVQGRVADVHCIVIRNDRKSMTAYEIYVTRDFGQYLWTGMSERGSDLGLLPFGVEVLGRLIS